MMQKTRTEVGDAGVLKVRICMNHDNSFEPGQFNLLSEDGGKDLGNHRGGSRKVMAAHCQTMKILLALLTATLHYSIR